MSSERVRRMQAQLSKGIVAQVSIFRVYIVVRRRVMKNCWPDYTLVNNRHFDNQTKSHNMIASTDSESLYL
ncbi:unnamed protein product [Cylicostephanus goldi]|uniref:Uncharacterized protein n=1 Tax=Cylicostephanus goldi TaxID=71465 RepID=A0A3P6QZ52_CYLGO|nr:unnamed protein product [Cylicostephanus goldi]